MNIERGSFTRPGSSMTLFQLIFYVMAAEVVHSQ
jgi:hypothetical protein